MCKTYGEEGIGLFVYGDGQTTVFPARQTLEASQVVARQHGVGRAVFLQQNSGAIEAGAFHNDVVSVANGPVFFYHEDAFDKSNLASAVSQLKTWLDVQMIEVRNSDVSLSDAIGSYLFNSQLLASPSGDMSKMSLIAPLESKEMPSVNRYLEQLCADPECAIDEVVFVDVRQSMSNGGGPACLRLRVVLTEIELSKVNPIFLMNEARLQMLEHWISEYYRETLSPAELADPLLLKECHQALLGLEKVLGIEGFYEQAS